MQLLNQNTKALRHTARETEQRLASYETREKYLKIAEEAVKKEQSDKPVAVPIKEWGKDTGYVKVRKEDWQGMVKAYKNGKIKMKVAEKYETENASLKAKLTKQRKSLDNTKEFLSFHGLAEKYDKFIRDGGKISVRERLEKGSDHVKTFSMQPHVRDKGMSR